ncbi:MAG: biopolymer transporter ExbD [Prevotella sp.]|nr:biopolymer transporter ExbD [Prevotella sp.]
MGKVKIKKSDVWIDMTPMSDVMVLLLTFFMMTSTFVTPEPVQVNTPQSQSKVKVPDVDVLNILVNPDGKVFMSMDKVPDLEQTVKVLLENNGLPALTPTQLRNFKEDPMFGIGLRKLHSYLDKKQSERVKVLPTEGIPTDSIAGGMSEFQQWVKEAKRSARNSETLESHELKICIKADSKTSYKTVKKLMSELQDMEENRYQLITSYKVQETKEVQ